MEFNMDFNYDEFRREEETRPRIKVLVGEFGSGKTELAVNLATYLQKSGLKTAIADMDLAKPYFRTREHRQRLEADGVTVVMQQAGLAHADLPIMPQGLTRVLCSPEFRVVIDVGGAKAAIVLGQIREQIRDNGCEVLMVVNVCRPFSRNVAEIVDAMRNVEMASGLAITGLVSNTNLGAATTMQHVNSGAQMVRQVSELTGLPLRWLVAPSWLYGEVRDPAPVLPLHPRTTYPWDE